MRLAKVAIALFLLVATMVFTGCKTTSNNNHLDLPDVADHLKASGLNVTAVQRLDPALFHAMRACAIEFDNNPNLEIGVYKYDLSNNKMREFVEGYTRKQYAMSMGLKYPVVICGSFMFIGVEKNPNREAIIAALESFNK